jgi:predicted dinucleotide-binding enzyme
MEQLARGVGAEPVDLGPLHHAQHLEAMAAVANTLLFDGLAPPRIVFKLVSA